MGGGGGGGEEVKQIFVDIQTEIIKYNSASNTQILYVNNSCKRRKNTSALILSFRVNMDIQWFISKNKRTTGVLVVALWFLHMHRLG